MHEGNLLALTTGTALPLRGKRAGRSSRFGTPVLVLVWGLPVLAVAQTVSSPAVDLAVERTIELSDDRGPMNALGRIVAGDLDGDGQPELVLTNGSRLVKAFSLSGRRLWRRAAETGYDNRDARHPTVAAVWDLDGDGRDEVVTFLETGGETAIVVLDGVTGETKASRPYRIRRDPLLVVVHSEPSGVPSIVAADGDVKSRLDVFGPDLTPLRSIPVPNSGHHIYPYDVDEDPYHEIVAGSYILDHDGTLIWRLPEPWRRDHVDALVCADVHPDYPGLELVVNGAAGYEMYNLALRRRIWRHEQFPDPQHQAVGQFDEDPAPELLLATRFTSPRGQDTWLVQHDAQVRLVFDADRRRPEDHGCLAVDVDGDRSRDEILIAHFGIVLDGHGTVLQDGSWRFTGEDERLRTRPAFWSNYPFAFDLLGDSREELITHNQERIVIAANRAPPTVPLGPSFRCNRDYRLRHVTRNLNRAALYFDFRASPRKTPLRPR